MLKSILYVEYYYLIIFMRYACILAFISSSLLQLNWHIHIFLSLVVRVSWPTFGD